MMLIALLQWVIIYILQRAAEAVTATAFSPADVMSEYPENTLYQPEAIFPLGGMLPSARVHHSVVATNNYVVVYGGYYNDGSLLGDVNLFHYLTQQWSGPVTRTQCCNDVGSLIETIGIDGEYALPYVGIGFEGDFPLPRAEHGAAVVGDDMYIFGGVTFPFGFSQDLYKFDSILLTWTSMNALSSSIPCRRAGHSMVSDSENQFLYVFGGRAFRGGRTVGLSDVWRFDITDSQWSLLTNNVRAGPTNRQFASLGLINSKLYIFGGMDPASNVTFNDVWVFNVGARDWTQLSRNSGSRRGFGPPPLFSSYMIPIADSVETNVNATEITGFLVYGGIGGGGQCADITCRLQTSLGQVYRYSVTTNTWDHHVRVFATGTYNEEQYVNSSSWEYARLSGGGAGFDSQANDRGKFVKLYALEKAIYVAPQGRMYEFGGVQSTQLSVSLAGQSGIFEFSVNSDFIEAVYMGAGGDLLQNRFGVYGDPATANSLSGEGILWDSSTGEQLRTTVEIPTNSKWRFTDVFDKNYDARATASDVVVDDTVTNMTIVKLLRAFRTYSVNPTDVVLMSENIFAI